MMQVEAVVVLFLLLPGHGQGHTRPITRSVNSLISPPWSFLLNISYQFKSYSDHPIGVNRRQKDKSLVHSPLIRVISLLSALYSHFDA